ncbi:histidine phosphatase family protein [Iodobacter fluviatilis]|uniref:Alpha-ribazole phosphatase n=1 Tax=Iodobacter fluviatilis TaxID=537 RepID=A0A377SUN2_9NEIS|nr:histidine phosphatase family protein [Iodobacter fluviatilis]TCU82190.1 broad specificity phosphatase PhoE [Iodobacter fluviatilis]STR45085.1 alpha-ribazole phosphatase [Iodobacter fluviatilis]
MQKVYFITHPEVLIAPDVPVTQWSLSEKGRERMTAFLQQAFVPSLTAIYSSEETKAIEAAAILAASIDIKIEKLSALGENDRTATGFLQKEQFEAAADQFFAHPENSFQGWERACDAQQRIINAVEHIIQKSAEKNIAIVAHGAVGTLYKCHLKNIAISRSEDQPSQGHYYCFDVKHRQLEHDWLPISAN